MLEKYSLGNLIQDTFPGLKPESNWPISLDDLLAKLNSLKIEELFNQPFDVNLNFQKEAEKFINTYFGFLKAANEVKIKF